MSGIVGVWNLDGRPLPPQLLADLNTTLAHRGPDGDGAWVEGSVGLACRLLRVTPEAAQESQPCVSLSGTALVFDGRLDNREELLASLEDTRGIGRECPDAELVLAGYEIFGERLPERLSGDFALAVFDPRRRQLLLARDAMGVRPLYYHRRQHLVVFASEIKALLAHPELSARPDDELLALFLLDDIRGREGRTFFEGIWAVPPASVAIVTAGGFTVRRYWDFDPSRRTRLGSLQEYAAAFRHHFAQAVRRRLRSAHPVAVSVSGGLDSSSIFCLAHRLTAGVNGCGPSVVGFSYTPPAGSPADETRFLQEIECQYGLAIERVPVEPMGLLNGCHEAVWHVEAPFVDEQWNTQVSLLEAVRRRGCRVLLTGHWGDQMLFDQAYLVDFVRRLAWRQAGAHLGEYGRWLTDADPQWFRRRFLLDLLKYSVPAQLLAVLRRLRPRSQRSWYGARLTKHARPWRRGASGSTPVRATAHARSLYEQARSGYHVLCMEWNNKVAAAHGLEMAFPFLDRDLVALLMGLPGEAQTWQGVPKALLREAMRGVLPDPIVRRTWKADFTSLVNEGMERDFPLVVRAVCDGTAAQLGYLDRTAIREDVEGVHEGLRSASAAAAWKLSDALGLELWLQAFRAKETSVTGTAKHRGGQR